jgi:hypothetical protein
MPSATSIVTVNAYSATADQTATTGVNVTIIGASLQDGTQLNVTSTNYGSKQPSGTGIVSVNGAVFYDVRVTSSSGALGLDVLVTVSISNPAFTSASVIEYWNGNTWVSAATTFTAPDTVSCTIPASALTGAIFAVGTPTSGATSLWLITIIVVVVVVILVILFVYMKKRKSKIAPQSAPTGTTG